MNISDIITEKKHHHRKRKQRVMTYYYGYPCIDGGKGCPAPASSPPPVAAPSVAPDGGAPSA